MAENVLLQSAASGNSFQNNYNVSLYKINQHLLTIHFQEILNDQMDTHSTAREIVLDFPLAFWLSSFSLLFSLCKNFSCNLEGIIYRTYAKYTLYSRSFYHFWNDSIPFRRVWKSALMCCHNGIKIVPQISSCILILIKSEINEAW